MRHIGTDRCARALLTDVSVGKHVDLHATLGRHLIAEVAFFYHYGRELLGCRHLGRGSFWWRFVVPANDAATSLERVVFHRAVSARG